MKNQGKNFLIGGRAVQNYVTPTIDLTSTRVGWLLTAGGGPFVFSTKVRGWSRILTYLCRYFLKHLLKIPSLLLCYSSLSLSQKGRCLQKMKSLLSLHQISSYASALRLRNVKCGRQTKMNSKSFYIGASLFCFGMH